MFYPPAKTDGEKDEKKSQLFLYSTHALCRGKKRCMISELHCRFVDVQQSFLTQIPEATTII